MFLVWINSFIYSPINDNGFLLFTIYWEIFVFMLGIDIMLLADQFEYHRTVFF